MVDGLPPELQWGGPGQGARIAEQGCILRTAVGSQVHGLAPADADRREEIAIAIEPPEHVIGLRQIERWPYRTQPEGVPSGPGGLDLVVYGLRRYCQLALEGSPRVLLPLFVPEDQVLLCTGLGRELRAEPELFVGRRSHRGYLRCLKAERGGLLEGGSSRGQPREGELSAEHGYDTERAMHAVRTGHQGLELAETGRITLPVPEPARRHLVEIGRGEVPLDDVLGELDDLIQALGRAPFLQSDPPGEAVIEQWLIQAYRRHWDQTWRPVGFE